MQSLAQSNPQLRIGANARRDTLGGRAGLTTQLSNVSEVTGEREYVANTYGNTFRRVRQNLQIADR